MDDPIYSYFHENLAMVSKEELLLALGNALESANCWRQACLLGYPSLQTRSQGEVGNEPDFPGEKQDIRFHSFNKEAQVSVKA